MKSKGSSRTKVSQMKVENSQKSDDDEVLNYQVGNIDDYSVNIRLGRGKYSNVFRGHSQDGQMCVIKVLKPVRISKINREIKILEILRGGPYISQLLDVVKDEDSESIALVLNWSDNVNIRNIFSKLTEKNIATYIYKVLKALEFAHSKGIMHRDIKPGNIMYTPETDNVCVIDWGLAEFYDPQVKYPVRVATRHYKGPELLLGYQNYDYSLDIWCLGCTLASLLFQKIPFFRGNDNDEQIIKMAEIFGGSEIIKYAEKYGLDLSSRVSTTIQNYKGKPWSNFTPKHHKKVCTPEALDLLSQMLIIDHKKRPTATELLRHPFFDIIRDHVENE